MSDAATLPSTFSDPTDEATSDPTDDSVVENVLDFVLGLGAGATDPSADRAREQVLEVVQVFGDSVLELKHFAPGRAVSLGGTLVRSLTGTRMREDFFVPATLLPNATHPLFEADGRGWICVLDPGWTGYIEGPHGRRPLGVTPAGPDGLVRMAFAADERAVIDLGSTTFVARAVHPSRKIAIQRDGVDYPMLGIAGFMGFVAMFLGVALSVVPSPARASRMADIDRVADLLLDRPTPPLPAAGADPAPRAAAHKGPMGNPGEKDKPDQHPLTRRLEDIQVASETGLVGLLNKNAALATLLGDSALPSELDAGIVGLIGPRATQNGTGGLGNRPGAWGGNGTAESMGSFGPQSRTPGGDGRYKPGPHGVKPTADLTDPDSQIIAIGSLDRAQIDAVVKRNMAQIRYCYQRELNKNPALSGKVNVKFVIAKDGSVSQAVTKSSTLGNPVVESCINSRILRFAFPEPKGGGIVIVSYPFLFAPG